MMDPLIILIKLRNCCDVLDFTHDLSVLSPDQRNLDSIHKRVKLNRLNYLIRYIEDSDNAITKEMYPEIVKMVSMNIFRSISPSLPSSSADSSETPESSPKEAAWQHLRCVYIIFWKFLGSPSFDGAIAKRYINQDFVTQLLSLFECVLISKDQRESTYIRNILRRISYKFVELRPFIEYHLKIIERNNGYNELCRAASGLIEAITPTKENQRTSWTEEAPIVDNSADESLLVLNASDIPVIAAKEIEAIEKSLHAPPSKGILVRDGITNPPATMNVKIVEEEKVHIIASDHDGKELRPFVRDRRLS